MNNNLEPKFKITDYTNKELLFVDLLCDYNNTIEGAYRIAYKIKPEKKAKHAWVVYKQPHIQELISIKRQEVFENSNINFTTQIQKLEEIRYLAMQDGKYDTALKAIDKINIMLGWNVQRIETTNIQPITINYIEPIKTIDITPTEPEDGN